MRIRALSFLASLAWLTSSSLTAQAPPPAPQEALDVLHPEIFKGHLYYVASDTLAGRNTPSPGLDMAADYIAAHMRRLGYLPGGDDGSYFQRIRLTAAVSPQVEVLSGAEVTPLEKGMHWSGFGEPKTADVVFAGFGLTANDGSYDDFADLEVEGKIVVVLRGRPKDFKSKLFTREVERNGRKRNDRLRNYTLALEKGAAAVFQLTRSEGRPASASRVRWSFPGTGSRRRTVRPLISITKQGEEILAKLTETDFAALEEQINASGKPASRALGVQVKVSRSDKESEAWTQNVVAILPGTDPELKDQYVAFGAHYDHVGEREKEGDGIYNGADDDGSGTVSLLVLAEAFTRVADRRRSLVFVWHTGEEKGLQGARYFVENPLVPLEKIACLFNIDMIGRNYEDKPSNSDHVYLVGAKKISSEMDPVIREMNEEHIGLRLDDSDPASYYTRSDHYMYARKGIPIVFFCTGEHGDYHGAGDHPDKILYEKMNRIVKLTFLSSLHFVNKDEMPVRDLVDSKEEGESNRRR